MNRKSHTESNESCCHSSGHHPRQCRDHDLRHSCATFLLQQGVSPKVVQEILGHSDITLTLNTYSHVTTGMQKEAAAKVDELLTPIDVSEQLRKVEEQRPPYAASSERTGAKPSQSPTS